MRFEYQMLILMTVIYLLAWAPVSVAKAQTFGKKWLSSNRDTTPNKTLPLWGGRAERAYQNLKDYFPGFVVAILLLGQLNRFDDYTSLTAGLYVLGRMLHYISYAAGFVPGRFLAYVLAMVCNFFLLYKAVA